MNAPSGAGAVRRWSRLAAGLLACSLLAAPVLAAPRATVRADEPPHYTDVPITVQVFADEFDESPPPTVDPPRTAGLEIEFQGAFPNISSRVEIINGNMRQWKTVRYRFDYRVRAAEPGVYALAPFTVRQGTTQASTAPLQLRFVQAPTSDAHRIELQLPAGPVYVNQRFPVRFEWWISQHLAERLGGRRVHIPLFDRVDQFRFEDRPDPAARTTLAVQQAGGEAEYPASVRRETADGQPFLVLSIERTGIALKPGQVQVEPATVLAEEVVRWQRNVFGERIASGVRRLRAVDTPRTLEVLEPPAAGRPASFTGIVGQGLTVTASANRSVVQVGDPISLTLSVAGDAVTESISLPPPPAMGLATEHFRAPAEPPPGEVRDGAKHFSLDIRIMDERIREIPPLEVAWFDPTTGGYATARTEPIAVSVRAARVIGAGDVVRQSQTGATADGTSGDVAQRTAEPEPAPAADRVVQLTGADLAIESDLARLMAGPQRWYAAPAVVISAHCGALALLAAGYVARRRAARDPRLVERQRACRALAGQIEHAGGTRALLRALASAGEAGIELPREPHRQLVAELEQMVYAPGATGEEAVADDLRARAHALLAAATRTAAS